MVVNKQHFTNDHGFFYVGVNSRPYKNGRGKIGTTEQSNLNKRISVIKAKGESDFTLCAFLRIENCTKAQLEFVEAYTRMMLEKDYQHTQNDHFEFKMNNKIREYNNFIHTAINYGVEACNMQGFEYHLVSVKEFGKRQGLMEQLLILAYIS